MIVPTAVIAIVLAGAVALGVFLPVGARKVSLRPGGGGLDRVAAGSTALQFLPPRIDFGGLAPHERVDRVIEIRNEGTRAAAINDIVTSCTCLRIQPHAREIAPGESIEATIELIAPQRQDAPLRYTAAINPVIGAVVPTLHVTGFVRKVFHLEPMREEVAGLTGVRVSAIDGEAFRIVETPPFLHTDANLEQTHREVEFRFGPSRGVERFSAQLPALVLEHPSWGTVTIDWPEASEMPPMSMPPMRARPEFISLMAQDVSAGTNFDVVIEGPTEREVADIGIEVPSRVNVELGVMEAIVVPEGVRYTLHLKAPAERWESGAILFTYKGIPACTLRVSDDRIR